MKVNFKKGLAASYFMFQAAGTFEIAHDCTPPRLSIVHYENRTPLFGMLTARCVHTHEAIIVMNDPYDNISLIYILSQSIISLSTWSAIHKIKGN